MGASLAAFVLGALACATRAEPPAAAPPPATYRTTCNVADDCALVPHEGCGRCDKIAISGGERDRYMAAWSSAQQEPACRKMLERAGPCASMPVKARCDGQQCVAEGER